MIAAARYSMQSLCEITSAKRIFAADYVGHGIPFYRGKEITEKHRGNQNVSTELFISEERFRDIEMKFGAPLEGDLLLTSVGTLGSPYVVQAGERFYFKDGNLTWFRRFNGLDSRYLYYWLLAPPGRAELKKCTIGSSQSAYTIALLKRMEIDLPSLSIQHRIADILSTYDELIANNQRRIAVLEEMARVLYREWFVYYRAPGVVMGEDGMPEGWEVKRLGEIVDSVRNSVPKGELDEEVPYLGLEHIPRRSLALDAWEYSKELGSSKLQFNKGDVLFGKIRPYFHKVSVAPFDGLCSSDTIVIRAKDERFRALATCCVASDEFVAHATATSNGSKMPRADWKVLKDYPVPVPKLDLLERFSTTVSKAIEQMQGLIFQNQNLRRTRDLLLPRLMSGRLDVNNY